MNKLMNPYQSNSQIMEPTYPLQPNTLKQYYTEQLRLFSTYAIPWLCCVFWKQIGDRKKSTGVNTVTNFAMPFLGAFACQRRERMA